MWKKFFLKLVTKNCPNSIKACDTYFSKKAQEMDLENGKGGKRMEHGGWKGGQIHPNG